MPHRTDSSADFPSPRWGEGVLSAPSRKQQLLADGLKDALGVFQDVVVSEAEDAVAEVFDRCGSVPVDILIVLAAVEFDHEMRVAAGEVGDVLSNRELADELGVFELATAEVVPETLLGVGGCATEFTRNRRQAFFRQRCSPSPQPSPHWGEGALADRLFNA